MSSMKELTMEALLGLLDKSIHEQVQALAARDGVEGLVLFENLQMDSSSFGERSVLAVGPGCTYKSVEECEGQHLNDLPSQRKYATQFWRKRMCALCFKPMGQEQSDFHNSCANEENLRAKYQYENERPIPADGIADGGEPYTKEELGHG